MEGTGNSSSNSDSSGLSRRSVLKLGGVALGVGTGMVGFSAREAAASTETVTVDLAAPQGAVNTRAAGILGSMSGTEPAGDLVTQLKPTGFRGNYSVGTGSFIIETGYPRLIQLGFDHIQVILSFEYRLTGSTIPAEYPGNDGFVEWDGLVDNVLNKVAAAGQTVQYDIWNEPNAGFWPWSDTEFFELWKHTYQRIKAFDPNAEIVGPSAVGWAVPYMEDFLDFAKTENVLPDVLSWHALYGTNHPWVKFPDQLAAFESFMAANNINITRYSVNEYASQNFQLKPGVLVGMFGLFEEAGVETAMRGCFGEPEGTLNCSNSSLDGLLTNDPLDTVTVTGGIGGAWYELDVTRWIKSQLSLSHDIVAMALRNPNESSQLVVINSREAASNRPHLRVTTTLGTANTTAVQDAYVRAGSFAGTNFGTETELHVKTFPSDPSLTRWSYLKFDLTGFTSEDVNEAILRVFATFSDPVVVDTSAWGVFNTTSWNETSITWNNKPVRSGLGTSPRAAWWANKAYADLSGSLVQVTPSSTVRGMASWDSTNKIARALLGRSGTTGAVDVVIKDGGLAGNGGQVRARVELIPANEHTSLVEPQILSDGLTTPVNGDVTVHFFSFTDNDAVAITLTPPPIYPIGDAYVRGGSFADTNFGTATELHVKEWGSSELTRWAYLKFNLAGVNPQDVNQARLWLFGGMETNKSLPAIRVQMYAVANTSWTETGITWNNKPPVGSALDLIVVDDDTCRYGSLVTVPVGCWFTLNVTNYVISELTAGRTTISLALQAIDQSGPRIVFASRETANQPHLIIITN